MENDATLKQFLEISGSGDEGQARALLEAHAWNLEAALGSFFEGFSQEQPVGTTHTTMSNVHEDSQLRQRRPQTVTSASTSTMSNSLQNETFDEANRHQQSQAVVQQRSTPLSIIWLLALLPWRMLQTLMKALSSLVSFSSPPTLPPSGRLFKEYFEAKYGTTHPEFFEGTYINALETAKRELKYLLVYLESPDHLFTDSFNRLTLTSPQLIEFLNSKPLITWAASITNPDGYHASSVLSASGYPFLALIMPQNNRMVVVFRVEGPIHPADIITNMESIMDRTGYNLEERRMEQAQRDLDRRMREMQDEAYERSLAADRERLQKVEEEKQREEREKAEKEQREREMLTKKEQRIKAKKERREQLKSTLPPEPPSEVSSSEKSTLSIKLPDGQRIIRRFYAHETIQNVYDFLETCDTLSVEKEYVVVNTYPRKELREMDISLREAGLCPNGAVLVEEDIDVDEL